MSAKVGLAAFAAELGFAAGGGANRIAAAVTASGSVAAKTGVAVDVPGPALAGVLARHSGQSPQAGGNLRTTDAADTADLAQVAEHMAQLALRRGADLLSGL